MGPGVSSGNPLPVGCEESVVAYPTAVTAGQLRKLPGFRRWKSLSLRLCGLTGKAKMHLVQSTLPDSRY